MRILYVLLIATAPLASAQSLASQKLPDNPQKFEFPASFGSSALQKSLGGQPLKFEFSAPFSSSAVQRAVGGQPQILVLQGTQPQEAKVCATRLLEFKADPSVDPHIQHRLPQGVTSDKNAFRLPLPVCPAQR